MNEEKNTKIEREQIEPKTLLEWQAKITEISKKNIIRFGILALLIIGYFIWAKNYFGALVIFLGYVVFYLQYGRQNEISQFILKNDGIQIDNHFFEYADLKNFSINYKAGGIKELKIISKRKLMPEIKIPIGESDPTKIREILLKFLPEKEE